MTTKQTSPNTLAVRDRAVATLRVLALTVVLLGMAATGALAGLFARQLESVGVQNEDGGQQPAQQTKSRRVDAAPRQITIVVHRGDAGTAPAQPPAAGPLPPAEVPAPQAPPTVQAPAEPVESAGTSSGSSPG